MFCFEKLEVYQDSISLAKEVNGLAESLPDKERWGLSSQLRRAAVSVSLNIAEGSARTKRDNANFLRFARGSVFEVVAILQVVNALNYIKSDQYQAFYDRCEVLAKRISSLLNTLL
jgi:four helix bundle protein